jgi:hypothetical protein
VDEFEQVGIIFCLDCRAMIDGGLPSGDAECDREAG